MQRIMSISTVCSLCVVGEVKLLSVGGELQEIYEKLTNTKLSTDDRMPRTVCYICYSQLKKCHKFAEMALKSEKLLRQQFDSGNENITHSTLPCSFLNLRLVENLSVTIAHSQFIDDYTNSECITEHHPKNYVRIHENTSISVKVEVKRENMDEEPVKTEILVEGYELDSIQDTEQPLSSNIANKDVYYCKKCNEKYVTKNQMRSHLRMHCAHKPFVCWKCEKSFYMSHNLKKHIQFCSGQSSKSNTTCSTCKETFSDITSLRKHMKTHSEERPYICDRCSNKFKTRTHLNVHMKIHAGERPFPCEVCGKAFTQVSNLKTHKRIHEGTKPFACEVCGKAFLTNGTLKSHMRCHTGERPFACTTCGMTFGFKCSLNQHIKRLHTEVKAYPCSKCHQSFHHEVGLTAHMRGHFADRAYPCDKCSKSFTSARNLKGHNMQVHSGERPHGCSKCGTAYKRPEHLRQHMRSSKCKAVTASMAF